MSTPQPLSARRPSSRRVSELERRGSSFSRRPSIDPRKLIPMDRFACSLLSLCAVVALVISSYAASFTPFHRMTHIGGTDDFNVVFIGAGNIMFGTLFYFQP